MSGFRKAGIFPLNPGQITDRQTAPSKLFSSSDDHSDNSIASSDCSSTVTRAGSVPVSEASSSYLDEVLSLSSVQSGSKPKSVNSEARCITDDSFVQEMEDKEKEKRRKEEEIIMKREEKARKKKERELKKIEKQKEKELRKLEREKKKIEGQKKKRKCRRVEAASDSAEDDDPCPCPVCGVDYYEDSSDSNGLGVMAAGDGGMWIALV